MDWFAMFGAVIAYFQTNWPAIEGLARNIAADLVALWVLAMGLAEVLRKFLPGSPAGSKMKTYLTGLVKHDQRMP